MTTVTREIHFARKTRRKVIRPGPALEPPTPQGSIPRVSKLMALAIRFDRMLADGQVASMSELARVAHVTQPRMTQIMNLLHLAPDIQEELLHLLPVTSGDDPITERDLRPIAALPDWRKQRHLWQSLGCRQSDPSEPEHHPRHSHANRIHSIEHAYSFHTSAASGSSFSSALASRQDG